VHPSFATKASTDQARAANSARQPMVPAMHVHQMALVHLSLVNPASTKATVHASLVRHLTAFAPLARKTVRAQMPFAIRAASSLAVEIAQSVEASP